jgi:surfeit locus 1 family protein
MSLRIASREFAPRLWAVLLTAALLAAFIALGWWQVGRAREKQAMIESFQRGAQSVIVLADDDAIDELPRYQHVRVEGRYEPAHQVLIDNMPSQAGLPGFRVLTPFRRDGSERLLLVDRGWVPLGATRQDLPPVLVAPDVRAVSGRLDTLPAPGVRVGNAGVEGDTSWPRVLNFPRQRDLEQALGAKVETRILLLDPAAPDGYERAWRPAMQFGPERHLGYAIQWFTFALVALIIFFALSLRRLPGNASAAVTDSTSGSP